MTDIFFEIPALLSCKQANPEQRKLKKISHSLPYFYTCPGCNKFIYNTYIQCSFFSGLVGLSLVKDLPKYFSQLVIMNTGLPTGNDWKAMNSLNKIQRVLPFCLWRSFVSLFATLLPGLYMIGYGKGKNILKFPP